MITITIKTDNAAFQDGNREAEICRILTEIANRTPMSGKLRDVNGNTVGAVKVTGKDRQL